MSKINIFEFSDYRLFLRYFLSTMKEKNPSFSLTAMAKKVGLPAQFLSSILRFKKNLSHEKARQVAEKMNLKSKETEYFLLLVEKETTKNKSVRDGIIGKIQRNRVANRALAKENQIEILAEWYYSAIYELIGIEKYQSNISKMAKDLRLTESQVLEALEVLVSLGFAEKISPKCFRAKGGNPYFDSSINRYLVSRYHEAMMKLGIKALYEQDKTLRLTGSEVLMVDTAQLPEVREIVNEALNQVVALLAEGKNKTHLYYFGINMFSLTPDVNAVKSAGVIGPSAGVQLPNAKK